MNALSQKSMAAGIALKTMDVIETMLHSTGLKTTLKTERIERDKQYAAARTITLRRWRD